MFVTFLIHYSFLLVINLLIFYIKYRVSIKSFPD